MEYTPEIIAAAQALGISPAEYVAQQNAAVSEAPVAETPAAAEETPIA